MSEHSEGDQSPNYLNTVSSFRLYCKSEWLDTIIYDGEEAEVFLQTTPLFAQVFVVRSSDMKLQCIPVLFHTIFRRD